MPDTVHLAKRDANPYAHLVRGDEFVLIKDEPIINIHTGEPVAVGDGVQLVHTTAEPGYIFTVRAVLLETVYQLEYLGKFGEVD